MLSIIEIHHQMKQGATAPYLCSADDGKKYVIKRQRAGFEGCIKEWLFGKLGHYFGLPIPCCELVYVDRSLLEYNDTYQFEIGEGMAFGSEHIPDLQEVNYQILQSLPPNTLKDLYVFDYWIRNADRNLTALSGNPNLFYKQSTLEVIVLDHNLAFDSSFMQEQHRQLHLGSTFWPPQIDYDIQQKYEQRMQNSIGFWQEIIAGIPDDWKYEVNDFDGLINQIKLILNEYQNENFWEELK
ncbi:hypothetical protein Q4575_10645 [Psychrosphaera sp. 1_MG-2023]|uniref:HipA family kinase n=1 Tax=Psychrosphaera sp. 1_MG-2023 TaxID=3062643 RepID=UPI0026E3A2A6|nr:HipA family kinase [Psychrosphaera sp. 1_MG-2023]MDO6719863.1 hypothetical protein [Psychrosphaera sp. 1_MG-2023]